MTTTPSHQQGLKPTISLFKPIIDGGSYTPDGLLFDTLTDQVDTYQHTIQAFGGYWNASFAIRDRKDRIEEWIDKGIGRHIVVHDNTLTVIWEGFVNRISATLGPLSVVRGPLMDVANRVNMVYSTVDTSTDPPTMGVRERTGVQENTDSQDKYGILETYLSCGGATEAEAQEARNQYLEERKEPKTTQTVALGAQNEPTVLVECLGYVEWFKRYVYNYTTNTGTQDLDDQLQDIIDAQLNGIIDETFNRIDTNTLAVKRYENDDNTAMDLIKGLIAQGDAADDRYLFGVYANRVPVYEEAPTELEYQLRLADPRQQIETIEGNVVMPWQVLPGKWLLFSDLLLGKSIATDLRLDPRAMFIESVTFTAPWGLSLQGGDTDKLSQKLAKMGLAGVGG